MIYFFSPYTACFIIVWYNFQVNITHLAWQYEKCLTMQLDPLELLMCTSWSRLTFIQDIRKEIFTASAVVLGSLCHFLQGWKAEELCSLLFKDSTWIICTLNHRTCFGFPSTGAQGVKSFSYFSQTKATYQIPFLYVSLFCLLYPSSASLFLQSLAWICLLLPFILPLLPFYLLFFFYPLLSLSLSFQASLFDRWENLGLEAKEIGVITFLSKILISPSTVNLWNQNYKMMSTREIVTVIVVIIPFIVLTMCHACSKHFTDIKSVNHHGNHVKQILSLSPSYLRGNWFTEWLSNLSEVKQLANKEAGIWFSGLY